MISEALQKYDIASLNGIFVNEHEGAYLSGKDNVEEILQELSTKYPDLEIILTFGSKGAYYHYKDTQFFVPAHKVKAVDTTAAGDTFTGYFVALQQQGKSAEECMQAATKAAAITVTRKGAAASIPQAAEVY